MRSDEPFLPAEELERELALLQTAIRLRDVDTLQAVLMRTVEGYQTKTPPAAQGEERALATWSPTSRTLH